MDYQRVSLPLGPGSLNQLTQSATHVLRLDRSGPTLLIDMTGKKPVAHQLPSKPYPRKDGNYSSTASSGGFSADGKLLVLLRAGIDHLKVPPEIELVDVQTRAVLGSFALKMQKPYGAALHPDGQQIIVWGKPETVVFSLKGKVLDRIGTPESFCLSPNHEFMCIELEHGKFLVRPRAKMANVKFEASEVTWADDSTLIATVWAENDKSEIHRVDAKTGKMKKLATIPQVSAFDAHGDWALATNIDGKKVLVTSIDLNSGKTEKVELVGSPSGTQVSLGPAGAFISVNWQKVLHTFSRRGAAKKTAAPAPEKKLPKDPSSLIARIEEKAKKANVKLNRGASEKAIAAAEKALGAQFPEEVKAFYRAHDGSDDDCTVEARELLSLTRIVSEWKVWKDLLDKGTFGDNDHSEPDDGVQQKWWIPEWIPMTYDGSGNHHVLDLAPGKGGTRGQIMSFWHDAGERTVEGKDFLSWLAGAEWGDPDHVDEAEESAQDGDFVRYEMAAKFWAVKLEGSSFTVRFGKQGTDGQEQVKSFADAALAKKEHDKLVASKTKKGYRAV
jgi:cell wall assembly regulator SMI1/predicted DNA-binding WGR domain protein